MTGALILLSEFSRLPLWPYATLGVVVIFLNLIEGPLERMRSAEIVGALVTWAFTAWTFAIIIAEFAKHDQLYLLPDVYMQATVLSVGCVFLFAAGLLDLLRKPSGAH